MNYIILFLALTLTLSAQESYSIQVESKNNTNRVVDVSEDPQKHKCVVTIDQEHLVFDMDMLNKPHGIAFSLCWIGCIDYASGRLKLYSRESLNCFRKNHRSDVWAERQIYRNFHPEYSWFIHDKDYRDRTLLSFWENHSESNALIYTGTITQLKF